MSSWPSRQNLAVFRRASKTPRDDHEKLVAERVVSGFGSGQATTVGEERLDLATLSVNVVDGLDGVEVVETRVETDLVHDRDAAFWISGSRARMASDTYEVVTTLTLCSQRP